jgi:iron-sulfur cluster insertion protein
MNVIINVTPGAIDRIKHLINNEKADGLKLRVSVESGGCSGMQYKYEFVHDIEEGDAIIASDGVTLLIDPISQEFLAGATIDYIENLGSAYFEIRNPQASAKCGCGNSFAV